MTEQQKPEKPVPRRWTAAEIGIMIDVYPDQGLKATLALLPGRLSTQVVGALRRFGLRLSPVGQKVRYTRPKKPKPPKSPDRWLRQAKSRALSNKAVNVHFFEEKTRLTAWAAGVIWRYGRIRVHRKRRRLEIVIPRSQLSLLEDLKAAMSSLHAIRERRIVYIMEVTSAKIVDDLRCWGYLKTVSRKRDSEIPKLDEELAECFQRGYNGRPREQIQTGQAGGEETPQEIGETTASGGQEDVEESSRSNDEADCIPCDEDHAGNEGGRQRKDER